MGHDPRFEFLDHTADAKFLARGDTFEEALANAALAVASLFWDGQPTGGAESRTISIQGRDHERLVVRTLEEIVFLFETEGFLLAGMDDVRLGRTEDGWRLQAVFRGERLSDTHNLRGGVKAITYNELKIERKDGVTIQVVVDV
jgi:SHS2 domain-containing protein